MQLPSQSSKLNSIEHLWGIVKNKIGPFKSKNKQQMWNKVLDAPYSISPDI